MGRIVMSAPDSRDDYMAPSEYLPRKRPYGASIPRRALLTLPDRLRNFYKNPEWQIRGVAEGSHIAVLRFAGRLC
jgi:hypothetical protein